MNLHGFELLRDQDIPELSTSARLYRHIKTGAELLSLENADENKCFGITFCTPPSDSTGVAHILEHSVLCGSRKFPLKDPFVELLKGSLYTFLNALTYADRTSYPIASVNLRDFYNLADVYLDTVFHPRLARETFEQQGWHYELNDIADPLIYKGVVFNEMKGSYSSPDNLVYRYAQESLFPDNLYRLSSGGYPQNIPDLTYEQFTEFHRTYYHPSNARIFFSGDDEPEERLRLLDVYLSGFEAQYIDAEIPLQSRFTQPLSLTRPYAVSADTDSEKKAHVSVSWLLTEMTDPEMTLALSVLRHILIGTPASPLRKALLDSGLGEDLTGLGLVTHLRQSCFGTGLRGTRASDAPAIESLILETLQKLADEGIDPAAMEAALNTIEFSRREMNSGSQPRGLSQMASAMTTWIYGGDPWGPLAFAAPLEEVKAKARGGRYFEGLIQRLLLDNPHRTTLTLRPDPTLNQSTEAIERARLDAARAALSPAELAEVVERTQALKERQETPDPPEIVATLPMLGRSDLPLHNAPIPISVEESDGSRIVFHDLFTSGIAYVDIGLDLHRLPSDLLPYAALFGRAVLQLGTEREDYVRLTQRIGRETGGIRPELLISAVRGVGEPSAAWLFLRGKALAGQTGDLLNILRETLTTARWDDRDRLKQIALEEKAHAEAALASADPGYVLRRLQAPLSEAGWADERLSGMEALFFLRELLAKIDSDWPAVREALAKVQRLLVHRDGLVCNVTLDAENWASVGPQVRDFAASLPTSSSQSVSWAWQTGSANEGWTVPSQVGSVGKAANLYALGLAEHGSAAVISGYLSTNWLWQQVRVQGGAYGGFCRFDPHTGVFFYASYRDPNVNATWDVYDRTGGFLREAALGEKELTRSIIGAIGSLDTYRLPDARGFVSLRRYLTGDTNEWRQGWRDQVLSTTEADFRAFADVLDAMRGPGRQVVLGSADAISTANAQQPGLLEVRAAL